MSDLIVRIGDDHVAEIEINRPPNNFFDNQLVDDLADALDALDADDRVRVSVLCSSGKHFCAGADYSGDGGVDTAALYETAVRMFRVRKPIVAAIQGAAVGGGLGLALVADFRVAAPEARFVAPFARLGFHHGFGLSVTLPRLVGQQACARMLYTGRRVKGDEALPMGLCDRLVALDDLRYETHSFAAEIAESAPMAVESIRATLRAGLAERVEVAVRREEAEQARLKDTHDWREGVAADAERRRPGFIRS
jgi:enoyl-CoA hydratase/carnithine racemase